MAKSRTTKLVIDANVACSSGETEHPTSIHCRRFLDRVRELRCRIGMTPELEAEWKKHQSLFASSWLTAMVQRDQVENLEVPNNKELRDVLFEMHDSQSRRKELLKDAHLLEAALVFERRVASIERIARSWFARASATYQPITSICWVNPDTEHEVSMDWLQRGAPLEKSLQLGAFRKPSAATNIPKKKRKP